MRKKVLAALFLGITISMTSAGVFAADIETADQRMEKNTDEDQVESYQQSVTLSGKKKKLVDALGRPITKPGFYMIEDREYNVERYYVDENLQISKGNHTVYKRENDTVAWLVVDKKWYLVDASDGHFLTGWQEVGNNLYYLDQGSGEMVNGNQDRGGWLQMNGKWYAFYSWGGARRGWYTFEGKTYYLQDGCMQQDSMQLDGKLYYFNRDGWVYQNCAVLRWNEEEKTSTYYIAQADGSINQTPGWCQMNGKWYWVQDESGKLFIGELDYKNNHYCFLANGEMVASMTMGDYYYKSWGGRCENEWAKIDRKWYYFGEDGKKYTDGWLEYKGNKYYVDTQGRMYADRWLDDTYYFKSWGGMCYSTWMEIDDDWYYFQKDGKKQQNGWVYTGKKWYWTDHSGKMVSNCWKMIKNTWYYFKKDGSMSHGEWMKQGEHWYYLKDNGAMCQSESFVVNGVTYEFDVNGCWIK